MGVQILCLRRLIEESKASNRDIAMVCVDFSKEFDSVDRDKMCEILKLYGIPDIIISAINFTIPNTRQVRISPFLHFLFCS